MTDKEIIIDGVDVSKCRYFLKNTEEQDYNTDEFVKGCCEVKGSCIGYEFAGYGLCRGDKDCYFKQLACKTAECEELKKKIEYNNKQEARWCKAWFKMRKQRTKYRKALDSIEDICNVADRYELEGLRDTILDVINKVKDGNDE